MGDWALLSPLWTGTFRIDNFYQNPERGLETGDWAKSGEHFYSNKAPGASMLGVIPTAVRLPAPHANVRRPD
jgi:hypothetical protein